MSQATLGRRWESKGSTRRQGKAPLTHPCIGDREAGAARPSHQELACMRPRVTPFATCSVLCLQFNSPWENVLESMSKRPGCGQSCTLGCPGSQAGRSGCPPHKLTVPSASTWIQKGLIMEEDIEHIWSSCLSLTCRCKPKPTHFWQRRLPRAHMAMEPIRFHPWNRDTVSRTSSKNSQADGQSPCIGIVWQGF